MAPDAYASTGPLSQSRELKLQRLVEAGMLLNQELSLDAVLARIVEVAQHLLEAKYAALGVLADDKTTLKNFVTIGVSEDEKRAIGPLPTGKGILGAMLSEGHPLRLSDLNADPRSAGCPFPHPQMTSFLGVPILWRGQIFGRLYVTDKLTAESFSVEDEEIATMLAAQAAIAIENANLYERAQEANRMKSEFLANMSHELRTPMNSILGFTELVMNGTLGPVNEKQQQSLERVLRNGHHLLELINDVLDLSKIEAGKMTLTESEFSPEALLSAAWSTIEPMAGQKGLSARLDLKAAPAIVRGDEGKLRQVVLNLLSNAVKFTEAGTIGVRVEAGEDIYAIHVSDTGVGISPENLGLIFEEFRQVDASSTRQAGGTGLGLAISRKMTQLMGGDISVVSSVGEGSTFTIRLPRASGLTPASAVTASPTSASTRPEGLVVLAIDDDPEVLELMTSRLANTEFGVVTAQSGEAGLKLASEIKPDVITLDIMMPGLDGWEVLRRLKANPALKDIPVVMMSILENRALAFGMGASECLIKPVARDRLLDVLRRHAEPGQAPVLVVDDEADARALVTDILTAAGYRSVEAANGEEALKAIAAERPSLVVLDLMMPQMDGFAVLERLGEDPRLRTLPVVVLTAMALSPEDEARLRQSALLVLQKARTSPDTLLADLESVLRSHVKR